ncbi:MAG: hypothetical protein ABIT83_07090 [Massilia sp.]
MKPSTLGAAVAFAVAAVSACTARDPVPPRPLPGASIQDIMVSIVDPSADTLWDAVSTETSAKGTVEHHPQTDEEWQQLRRHAVTLAEAGNLLVMQGRQVSHVGKVEDAHVPGILAPSEIAASISKDRPAFAARARALQDAALLALDAIDAKSPQRLMAAGEKIDAACESCHMVHWYPNAEQPKVRWPAPIQPAALKKQ